MREYGQVQCALWTNPRFKTLSADARLLFVYLLSGPHSNGLGCYALPMGYVCADMKWVSERVSKGFQELFQNGFSSYCETTEFVFIQGYLKWNPISNGNVAKAREKEFNDVPSNFKHIQALAADMKRFGNHWAKGFETVIERVYQTRPNPTKPNQDPTQTILSGKPDDAADHDDQQPEPKKTPAPKDDTPERVIDYLNSKTGRKFEHAHANLKLIRARIADGATWETLAGVIDLKCADWLNDPKMHEYLRPATLFNAEKFNQYVGLIGAPRPKTQDELLDEAFGIKSDPSCDAAGNVFDAAWEEVFGAGD